MTGKDIRLRKFVDENSNNIVLLPIDHGITLGPIHGIKNMEKTLKKLSHTNVDGVILHKGNVKRNWKYLNKVSGLMIHLNASTKLSSDVTFKNLICTVEEAARLGADGVSIHVNLGSDYETNMLRDLGEVSRECEEWGMPLLAMMYVRGKNIKTDFQNIKFAARVAGELGADLVKVDFTGDVESFREVVESCLIPVIVAGGEKNEQSEVVLQKIKMAMEAGARGVACGRNVFQNDDPVLFAHQLCEIVHKKYDVFFN